MCYNHNVIDFFLGVSGITIQDVAKLAGVSAATVSRVLNNDKKVRPETADHVMNTIKQLGYKPNHLGRNLRKKQTKTVLVMASTVSNTLTSKVIRGIEETGIKLGYTVLIGTTNDDENREKAHIDLLLHKFVDGMIIMNTLISKDEMAELGRHHNIIQCCEYIPNTGVGFVSINNRRAAYEAVKHLIELGRRKIAYIGVKNHLYSSNQRYLGYKDALKEFGLPLNLNLIADGNYGFRSAIGITNKFILKENRPDALFAISDRMAAGAIRAMKEAEIKIPEDIAVVGFDNTDISYVSEPRITTVSQSPIQMGEKAMQLLDKKLNGEQEQKNIIIKHEIILRESTKIKGGLCSC
ncbi:MAG: LacI family transcriptional regulator [Firmicutes bacterium]|nr:LacI family transcriptional regulator [Bacillota bacterium]